jgi:solute carrier family 41
MKQDNCDINLLLESIPSLLISLIGLLTTGKVLEDGITDKKLLYYPLLLQTNCILNFKGNVELLFALYLSSMRQNSIITYSKYLRYVFDNANLVLIQSIIIGFTVGIIGISKCVFDGIFDMYILSNILTTSLITCVSTTILFILFLYLTIELSKQINVTPDNVILPTISSISDYLSIKFLIIYTKYFQKSSLPFMYLFCFLSLCLIPLCLFFICISKKRMPIQSIEVLAFTYILSTFGGYMLDHLSSKYQFLAASFPVYSGLAVAISFIYLHKIFTSINNNTEHDSRLSYLTLVITSFLMISFYIIITLFIEAKKSILFYFLFIILFVVQVIILLMMIESLAKFLQNLDGDVGIVSLPIITALGDVISTVFLILVAFSSSVIKVIK